MVAFLILAFIFAAGFIVGSVLARDLGLYEYFKKDKK
jgi:hypothetical protein